MVVGSDDLDTGEFAWLKAAEFKRKYSMSKESFHAIVALIKDHDVFKTDQNHVNGNTLPSPEVQLLVLLK